MRVDFLILNAQKNMQNRVKASLRNTGYIDCILGENRLLFCIACKQYLEEFLSIDKYLSLKYVPFLKYIKSVE